jgi:hypothetical protein
MCSRRLAGPASTIQFSIASSNQTAAAGDAVSFMATITLVHQRLLDALNADAHAETQVWSPMIPGFRTAALDAGRERRPRSSTCA